MSGGPLAWAEFPRRHTPEPARVRLAMGALLLLGALTGLLGALLQLWSLHLLMGPTTAGNFFLFLALGLAGGRLISARMLSRTASGLRGLLVAASLLAALSLVALSLVFEARWLAPPLVLLGLSLGGLASGVAWLLQGALTVHRAPAVMNLAGVSFGAGAVLICGFLWFFHDLLSLGTLERVIAVFPLTYGCFAWRNGSLAQLQRAGTERDLGLAETFTPGAVLLTLALAFQAANHWILAGWLAVYLSRRMGATTSESLFVLAVFWLALIWGRVTATRLPPLAEGVRYLVGASVASLVGAVFVLQTVEISGAVAGATLLGLGVGALHPLTVGNITHRFHDYHPGWVNGLFSFSFAGGALAAWLVGPLSSRFGIQATLWSVLLSSAAVLALLSLVVLETRLSESAEAA